MIYLRQITSTLFAPKQTQLGRQLPRYRKRRSVRASERVGQPYQFPELPLEVSPTCLLMDGESRVIDPWAACIALPKRISGGVSPGTAFGASARTRSMPTLILSSSGLIHLSSSKAILLCAWCRIPLGQRPFVRFVSLVHRSRAKAHAKNACGR